MFWQGEREIESSCSPGVIFWKDLLKNGISSHGMRSRIYIGKTREKK